MISSYAIALLTAASLVNGLGCSDKTNNIDSDADLSQLSDCTNGRVRGSIILGKGVAQPNLSGIREIGGDLICKGGVNATSLMAAELESIGGEFRLESMTNLNVLSMPNLASVGSLQFRTLPNLSTMTMAITKAKTVVVTDTVLETIDKLIEPDEVDEFDINNNRYLKTLTASVGTVGTSFSVTFNAKSLQVDLPNLIWANNLTFRDVGALEVPMLETVNGSFGLINCTFQDFTAPNLTNVGESLAVVDNNALTKLSFPELTKVTGGLQVSNNTKLATIDGFPKLESVGGAIDFNGAMKTVKLPKVDNVRGGFNLQTTSEKFNCDPFQKLKDEDLIQGDYLCKYALQEGEVGAFGEDKGGGKTGDGKSAASNIAISGVTLFGAALASLFYVL